MSSDYHGVFKGKDVATQFHTPLYDSYKSNAKTIVQDCTVINLYIKGYYIHISVLCSINPFTI